MIKGKKWMPNLIFVRKKLILTRQCEKYWITCIRSKLKFSSRRVFSFFRANISKACVYIYSISIIDCLARLANRTRASPGNRIDNAYGRIRNCNFVIMDSRANYTLKSLLVLNKLMHLRSFKDCAQRGNCNHIFVS